MKQSLLALFLMQRTIFGKRFHKNSSLVWPMFRCLAAIHELTKKLNIIFQLVQYYHNFYRGKINLGNIYSENARGLEHSSFITHDWCNLFVLCVYVII